MTVNNKRTRIPDIYIIEEEPKVKAPESEASGNNRRQKLLVRIGILLPLVLLFHTLAPNVHGNKQLPDFLQGTWETTDSRYEDCSMEITPGLVTFDTGERGSLLYFITSVEGTHDGGRAEYLVHYTDLDGMKYQMSLVYSSKPEETVHFSHQAGVLWTRRPSE